MAPFPGPFQPTRGREFGISQVANPAVVRFFNLVYVWMCVGLLVTGGVAWYTSQHIELVASIGRGFFALFILEIVLVMAISRAVQRINAVVATAMFLLYSAINGLLFSGLFLIYAHGTLASAFFISAGTFGAMSIYGMVTRSNLMGLGRYLIMALIGLVIASVVSIFWHNTVLQVVINYVGVFIFVALTAYDTQKLKIIAEQTQGDPALASRLAIAGSLVLYLDFINLFLFILQLMNDRRR